MMKLLADENIEYAMIQWLRNANYDVLWAAEVYVSAPDSDIITLARKSARVLLKRDLDLVN